VVLRRVRRKIRAHVDALFAGLLFGVDRFPPRSASLKSVAQVSDDSAAEEHRPTASSPAAAQPELPDSIALSSD
jgi:hypothetical protein